MREKNMRFGDFIKHKRLNDPRGLSLRNMSEKLGISASFLSDIENNRRKPFDKDKIKKFAQMLNISDEDKAKMYDLAARDRREVPFDIEDILMYSKIGDIARFALRQSNTGIISEHDWKNFIDGVGDLIPAKIKKGRIYKVRNAMQQHSFKYDMKKAIGSANKGGRTVGHANSGFAGKEWD